MPGIFGGYKVESEEMAKQATYNSDTLRETTNRGNYSLSLTYYKKCKGVDYSSITGDITAYIHGHVTNGITRKKIDRALENPQILRKWNGSWSLVATNGDKIIAATDLLASRPIYYSTEDSFKIGSEVKSILDSLQNWELDNQSIVDYLNTGFIWNSRTLVKEIHSIPPATAMVFTRGEGSSTVTYDQWEFSPHPQVDEYIQELSSTYKNAVRSNLNP